MARFRIFTEPQQGASYDQLVRFARRAEQLGFDGFFRSDHFLRIGEGDFGVGSSDAWISLAGIARETSRIRLGTLMSSATFRHPGALAVAVATVDQMSAGRVELGIGAGWYEAEHRAYGIPFPPLKERFDRLDEQLAIITGLWEAPEGTLFSLEGAHYAVEDSPGLPKPHQQPRPPIIIGGVGASRTPSLAARFADEFNTPFLQPHDVPGAFARLEAACERVGRDPGTIRRSCAVNFCCAPDEATFERRAAHDGTTTQLARAVRVAGLPAEVSARIEAYLATGADTIYLQLLDLDDLEHLELAAEIVAPYSD